MKGEDDITKLVSWEDGPVLEAARQGIPVILDRINEAKAQVTERLNPILEKNTRVNQTTFLVPEKGECTEIEVKEGFVIIATLTIGSNEEHLSLSPALRNRFVVVAVKSPVLDNSLRKKIAQTVMSRVSIQLNSLNLSHLPDWILSKTPSKQVGNKLAQAISGMVDDMTIRDVAMLAHEVRTVYDVLEAKSHSSLVLTCQLSLTELESDPVETLVHRTVNDRVPKQRFFFKGNLFCSHVSSVPSRCSRLW
jgi:midasin (ATPase involved in ribosome maturation)